MKLISNDKYREEYDQTNYESTLKLTKENDHTTNMRTVETLDFRECITPTMSENTEKMIIEDDFIDTKNSPFYFNDLQSCSPIMTNLSAFDKEIEGEERLVNFKSRFR